MLLSRHTSKGRVVGILRTHKERMVVYKVVETSTVTEDILERILNEWVREGWTFDSIHFVIRDASKRPSMAFIFFSREGDELPPDE